MKFYNKKLYAWFSLYLFISFIYFTYKSIVSVYAIYQTWLFIGSIILFPITFFLIPSSPTESKRSVREECEKVMWQGDSER